MIPRLSGSRRTTARRPPMPFATAAHPRRVLGRVRGAAGGVLRAVPVRDVVEDEDGNGPLRGRPPDDGRDVRLGAGVARAAVDPDRLRGLDHRLDALGVRAGPGLAQRPDLGGGARVRRRDVEAGRTAVVLAGLGGGRGDEAAQRQRACHERAEDGPAMPGAGRRTIGPGVGRRRGGWDGQGSGHSVLLTQERPCAWPAQHRDGDGAHAVSARRRTTDRGRRRHRLGDRWERSRSPDI